MIKLPKLKGLPFFKRKGAEGEPAPKDETPAPKAAGKQAAPEAVPAAAEVAPVDRTWRAVWPIPVLAAGAIVLVAGMVTSAVTRPKPDFDAMISGVDRLIKAEKHADAIAALNRVIAPYLDSKEFGREHRQAFYAQRARVVYLGQKSAGLDSEKNNRTILREYSKAVQHGATLSPLDMSFIADTHAALGNYEEAARIAGALPEAERARRSALFKKVIDRLVSGQQVDADRAMRILVELGEAPNLSADERAEVIALECDVLSAQHLHDEAVDLLLRTLATEDEASEAARGRLFLRLGSSYLALGDPSSAEKNLKRASSLLGPLDSDRGDAINMLGRIDLARGEPGLARERFSFVAEQYAQLSPAAGALLGVAEASAALGEDDSALAALEGLSDMIRDGWDTGKIGAAEITDLALTIQEDRFEAGSLSTSLEFARRAEALYAFDTLPPEVLSALTKVHRRMAENQLGDAVDKLTGVVELTQLAPSDRERARRHFMAAGAYARALADRLVLTSNDGYREALWLAADSFDRAGDASEALNNLLEYIEGFLGDPRQAEARFRTARIFQSRGEYIEAAQRYQSLISDALTPELKGVGNYATSSYVPLAQCLLLDSNPDNDAEAEERLKQVLDGEFADPSSNVFQEAVVAYGEMLYEKGRYAEAIERLVQASSLVNPDEHGARSTSVRFRLADSYRQSANEIRVRLETEGMPAHEQERLDLLRRERFSEAASRFSDLIDGLTRVDPSRLTPLEHVYLRNSFFYRGDCSYELALASAGEERHRGFTEAILSYEEALERYVDDPAALVAMIQITHCYLKRGSEGDLKRGGTVADRARRLYATMDPAVLNDPTLPLAREDWERWLDSIETLTSIANAEGA